MREEKFEFQVPVDLMKSKDGEWRVRGLASTTSIDQQGEILLQTGMDLTPINKKKGFINFDHQKGPENNIGILDGYSKTPQGLYLEGRLFKKHTRAKAVKEILDSLGDKDRGRMGMSVEGAIIKRSGKNNKVVEKCVIRGVALTMNPVNTDTYVDLVKSLNTSSIEFEVDPLDKALGVGSGYTEAPDSLTGGGALAQQSLDGKNEPEPRKRKLKKQSKELFKSSMVDVLDKLQVLYPDNTRAELWNAVQDRLTTKYPELK